MSDRERWMSSADRRRGGFSMELRVGCEFLHDAAVPVPSVWQVRPRPEGPHRILAQRWEVTPEVPLSEYFDVFGNLCDRLTLPAGRSRVYYDARIEVSDELDDVDLDARQMPIEEVPNEALVYLLPSRLCLSNTLVDQAWELFGEGPVGWGRVQAVADWVHTNIRYDDTDSTPLTTSTDVWDRRAGVCRDFTQMAVTFCRSLNIPARYVFGYLPDIGVAPTYPMDFCAWFEAYLGGRWWTFDPRNNERRGGRVVIGRGRDAVDVSMVTTYGIPVLEKMTVWADQADARSVAAVAR